MLAHYTYHYYATVDDGVKTTHIDGIFTTNVPIVGMDRYRQVKEKIGEDLTPQQKERLVIKSLSLLGAN